LREALERDFNAYDWEGARRFQETLGSYELSEHDLIYFLRTRQFQSFIGKTEVWQGLGVRSLRDRRLRVGRLTVHEAFTRPGNGFLTPIESAVNEIVWRIDRKWLCPHSQPELSMSVRTEDLRISGYAILRAVRCIYQPPASQEIGYSLLQIERTGPPAYNVVLEAPGISSVSETRFPPVAG
jgi:hypothetical protein